MSRTVAKKKAEPIASRPATPSTARAPVARGSDWSHQVVPVKSIKVSGLMPHLSRIDSDVVELQQSIQQHGILEPLLLRPVGDRFEIVAGHRRFMAARNLGFTELPALVKKLDDSTAALVAIHENVHRNQFTPLEEARMFQWLLEKRVTKNQVDLARSLGVSPSRISQKLVILEMPEPVLELFGRSDPTGFCLTERHARALKQIPGEKDRGLIGQRVYQQQLSARETEVLVRNVCSGLDPASRPAKPAAKWHVLEGARMKTSRKALMVEVQSVDPHEQVVILRRLLEKLEKDLGAKKRGTSRASAGTAA